MKLGTLKNGTRDGALVVVSRDLRHGMPAGDIAPTLRAALDDWTYIAPQLQTLYEDLNRSQQAGLSQRAFETDFSRFAAPLPRAYQWLDAGAYPSHVELARRARGAGMPPEAHKDPLMYQGDSEYFIGPGDPMLVTSEDWGVDLEGEIAVILGDVPMGAKPDQAGDAIRLLMLVNDVSLRNLIPDELAKGFGLVQGKGATAFSPVAVTPDELGEAWDGGKPHLQLTVHVNGRPLGAPRRGEDMAFSFPQLIAHAAKTRPLGAGTVPGSGTVSNQGARNGFACLAEMRALETVRDGKPATPFLGFGDRVRVEMVDSAGRSIFGAIDHSVARYIPPR